VTDRADLIRNRVSLEALMRYPGRLKEVKPQDMPGLVAELSGLLSRLGGLSLAVAARLMAETEGQTAGQERLLTAKEAAARLGTGTDYLYRRKDLPFRVQLSTRRVRFSEMGIERWLRTRRNGD
jgi:predicted DNA-binding transcriptional regulator AlpA